MVDMLPSLIIYAASILMAFNIYSYLRFSRRVREQGNWSKERQVFKIPIVLLILFLLGYLTVALVGNPDFVIAGILFGGSIFVFIMLMLMQRMFDRIRENERLEAKLVAAEEASKAKTNFLSNMSHDIRTPLNAIIGYTTLANGDEVTQEEMKGYIGKIAKASHQLLNIVDDVLEMSRIESGKMELEPCNVNIEDCIRELEDLVRTQLESKHLNFDVSWDVAHKWVLCDKNRLNRALMNLLCNAGKFTDENGSVSLRLKELAEFDGIGDYEIRVKDTGIGISPEFVEHLFTPFERERTSTVSRIQGTGLGMAITKNIIDMMGGTIDVETEKGKGTEFIIMVSLPIVEAEEQDAADEPGAVSFEGMRALLVEDNEVNREIAQMLLSQAGFEIDTAENGKQALDMVSASEPGFYDVVLMDVQMPMMDGHTASKAIRALPDSALSEIPIIAMTANAFQEDIRAAEEAGMNGHIAKPLDVTAMMGTLAQVLSA
ncbi:MAG: response regulator [Eggerthellaceae bacterium]|nr:response regulator [Eggerthellaceae bacterium]